MLDAVTGKHMDAAVVHAGRHTHNQRPIGSSESGGHVDVESELRRRNVKLANRHCARRAVPFDRRHENPYCSTYPGGQANERPPRR